MQNKKNNKNGYTIIETMISISLFLIIIMTGMGALLNANFIHKKSRDLRSIMDNLSFMIEDMSRNLRTGYTYHCIDDNNFSSTGAGNISTTRSGPNCRGIVFESAATLVNITDPNNQWVYYIGTDGVRNNIGIFKAVQGPYDQPIPNPNFVQLNPDEVTIDNVKSSFSVTGADPLPADREQPLVTIRLSGTINIKGVFTPFSLQTSVSQRLIDN